MFTEIYDIGLTFINSIYQYIPSVVLIYGGLSLVHQFSANMYSNMCAPLTINGIFMSPLMIVTPHCQGLQWVMKYSGDQIKSSWIWLGGYLVYYISNNVTPYINSYLGNSEEKSE